MSDIGVGFKVNRSGLSKGLKKSARTVTNWSKNASKSINNKLVGGLKQIPSALGVGLGITGVVLATKQLAQYEAQLARVAIQGKLSTKEQMQLAEEIDRVSLATGQSRSTIVSGIDAIVQRTGDIDQATASMETMVKVSQATGSELGNVGATLALLKRDFKMEDNQALEFFDLLTAQGKMGSFTLEEMSSQIERLSASAGRFGLVGIEGLKEINAIAQVARGVTSSSEEASTAVKATFADLLKNRSKVEKMGISFKNEDGSQKSVTSLLKEIAKATKGDKQQQKLQKIFNERSIGLVTKIANDSNAVGQFMISEKDYIGTIEEDRERFMKTASGQFQRIGALGEILTDAVLSGTLENIADTIEEMTKDPQKMEELKKAVEGIGVAVTAVTGILTKSAIGWGGMFNGFNDLVQKAANAWEDRLTYKQKASRSYGQYVSQEEQSGRKPLSKRNYEKQIITKAINAWMNLPKHIREGGIEQSKGVYSGLGQFSRREGSVYPKIGDAQKEKYLRRNADIRSAQQMMEIAETYNNSSIGQARNKQDQELSDASIQKITDAIYLGSKQGTMEGVETSTDFGIPVDPPSGTFNFLTGENE